MMALEAVKDEGTGRRQNTGKAGQWKFELGVIQQCFVFL